MLNEEGVGFDYGTITIEDIKSTIPRLSNHPTLVAGTKKREYSVSNTLTLEEIYEAIESQYRAFEEDGRGGGGNYTSPPHPLSRSAIDLTFEYLGMCCFASIVCAVGLVQNNDPVVVASMLLSPLMVWPTSTPVHLPPPLPSHPKLLSCRAPFSAFRSALHTAT